MASTQISGLASGADRIVISPTVGTINDNGADGVELDKGGNGSVYIDATNLGFDFNGEYCLIGDWSPMINQGHL